MYRFFRGIPALILLLFSLSSAIADTEQPVDMKRIISVGEGPSVLVFALEKTNEKWRVAWKTAGFVGRNGLTSRKQEGDGKTPAGTYAFGRAFGLMDDPGAHIPYTRLTDNDCWVDDPDSRYYNQWVQCDSPDRDWRSAETLSKETEAYRYAIVIEYNTRPIVSQAGSAIFLHVSKGEPTSGCISLPEDDVKTLLRFIDHNTKMTIVRDVSDLPESGIQETIRAATGN